MIEIRLNGQLLNRIVIINESESCKDRTEDRTADTRSDYSVGWWPAAAETPPSRRLRFKHRYGDSVLVLVVEALWTLLRAQPELAAPTRNRIRCVHCGDIVESVGRHQYVECKCGKVGVDGGLYGKYVRRCANVGDFEEIPSDAPHRLGMLATWLKKTAQAWLSDSPNTNDTEPKRRSHHGKEVRRSAGRSAGGEEAQEAS